MRHKLSIIIPAYNEGYSLARVIDGLKKNVPEAEIVVVNDGSTDDTDQVLSQITDIKVVRHPYNKGYGASLKSGINASINELILFYDADGQFNPEDIPRLLDYSDQHDLVIGARRAMNAPWLRTPGRSLLHFLANYLSDRKIPDLNSGFRLIKKSDLMRFWPLLPDSFSFSTTTTLAALRSGLNVAFVPISINHRGAGKSSVRPRHAVRMFFLILKTIATFSPLRVFMPFFGLLMSLGVISLIYDIIQENIGETTVALLVGALVVFLFSLLADQIALIRQQLLSHERPKDIR